MARTGLYKYDVKKARDALLAQGRHPSVDAVRVALGNTGSKTTIHKYLKELEEEEGGTGDRQVALSDALQNLVTRLAAQLQDEATQQIDALRAQHADQARQQAEARVALEQALAATRLQLQEAHTALDEEHAAHGRTREALQRETVARHTAEQQVADLHERLAENEAHRHSLEDKHQHAREALEHYRQSVKEQREADQRRHEQQIQQLQAELRQAQQTIIVKQEDVTRLNQEGARLVADLSHAQQALRDAQTHNHQLVARIDSLQAVERRCGVLEAQAVERESSIADLKRQLAGATASKDALAAQLQAAQLECASAKAALSAQQEIVAELRTYLDSHKTA